MSATFLGLVTFLGLSPFWVPNRYLATSLFYLPGSGAKDNPLVERIRTACLIIIVPLVILLIGVLPTWPSSHAWDYYPFGGVGILLAIVIAILLNKA